MKKITYKERAAFYIQEVKKDYNMNKDEAWKKFKETGKIEYYLKYKKGN